MHVGQRVASRVPRYCSNFLIHALVGFWIDKQKRKTKKAKATATEKGKRAQGWYAGVA